jgi:Plasmid pRiA4b ORF-3-like protein
MPADTSLARLHHIIQAAFGWLNYHLHQYIVDEQYFGDPNPEFADELPPMTDERDATLRDIVGAKAIVYEYDFGDSWRHGIEIESVAVLPDPGVRYPVCTGGARSRPPEDCGGTSGYEELLEVLADPKHEEHASVKKWAGKKFDPESFDLAAVNRALQRIASGSGRSHASGSRTATAH